MTQEQVITILSEKRDWLTCDEIARCAGVGRRTVYTTIKSLSKSGALAYRYRYNKQYIAKEYKLSEE